MNRILPLTLLGICAILAIGTAYEILARLSAPEIPPNAHRLSFTTPQLLTPPPAENFAEIDQRPIFNPERTPVGDSLQASGPTNSVSDLLLVGVIIAPDKSIALLKDKDTAQSRSVGVGDYLDDWRVEAIDKKQVTLASESGRFVIPLNNPVSGVTPAPPPAPVPQNPTPVPAAAVPPPAPASPPVKPVVAATSPSVVQPAGKADLLVHTAHGSVAKDALKGAIVDPSTGEPTL